MYTRNMWFRKWKSNNILFNIKLLLLHNFTISPIYFIHPWSYCSGKCSSTYHITRLAQLQQVLFHALINPFSYIIHLSTFYNCAASPALLYRFYYNISILALPRMRTIYRRVAVVKEFMRGYHNFNCCCNDYTNIFMLIKLCQNDQSKSNQTPRFLCFTPKFLNDCSKIIK